MSQETWETKAEVLGKPNLGEDILNTYNPRIRKWEKCFPESTSQKEMDLGKF